jgi:membrane protease subunit HflC
LGAAYGQDPDFFAFYRSLEAYQDAFPGDNTTMILSPNGEFFRYFGAPGRK